MNTKITAVIVAFLLFGNLFAQKNEIGFLEKKNQNTVDEQILALGYSFAHKFNPNLILGARLQAGQEIQFKLASSSINYDLGYGSGAEKIKPHGGSLEIFKLQLFYRRSFTKRFYTDAGPIFSFIEGGDVKENKYNAGIEMSAYYIICKINPVFTLNAGVRLKGVMSFGNPYNHNTSFFALYITPVTIGFNF